MEIESPYLGPERRDEELRAQFNVESINELVIDLTDRITSEYRLTITNVEYLRVPYDLVARLRTSLGTLYFKTVTKWLTDISGVLDLVAYLEKRGLPFPNIQRTRDNQSLITFKDREAYLCTAVSGKPVTPTNSTHLSAYTSLMATIHDLGATYAEVHGRVTNGTASRQSLSERIGATLPDLRDDILESHTPLFSDTQHRKLSDGIERIENTYGERVPEQLPRTHIHGDLRLCHALEQDGTITGVLDFDEITYGERLADICFGLISAPQHNSGKAVPPALQRYILREYDSHQSLISAERDALPTLLLWSNLVQLNGLCHYYQEGVRDTTAAQEATIRDVDDLLGKKSIIPAEWDID